MMQRLAGAVFLVLGTLLVAGGVSASGSLESAYARAMDGTLAGRPLWLLIGGAVSGLFGLALVLPRPRPAR